MHDRRRAERQSVTGRVRLWIFGRLGFVEGEAVNASVHGLGMELSPIVPRTLLHHGRHHRVEMLSTDGDTFSAMAEIRHISGLTVGVRLSTEVPLERFRSEADRDAAVVGAACAG